ncbi:hypothetical protein ABMA79_03185 [Halobacteriovorax sp. HFRX-2_2]|uniref:hypothetical protein n=1 Tax=unclassified Halobacteriovorax TaxID=2639665 RepID=UPI003718E8CB
MYFYVEKWLKLFLILLFLSSCTFNHRNDDYEKDVNTIKNLLKYNVTSGKINKELVSSFDECIQATDKVAFKKCMSIKMKTVDEHVYILTEGPGKEYENFVKSYKDYLFFKLSIFYNIDKEDLALIKAPNDIYIDMRGNKGGTYKDLNRVLCSLLLIDICPKDRLLSFALLKKITVNEKLFKPRTVIDTEFNSREDVVGSEGFTEIEDFPDLIEFRFNREEDLSKFTFNRNKITLLLNKNCYSACATMASLLKNLGYDVCTDEEEFVLKLTPFTNIQDFKLPSSGIRYVMPTLYREFKKREYQEISVKKCNERVLAQFK